MRQSIILLFLIASPLFGEGIPQKKIEKWIRQLQSSESEKRERAAYFLGHKEAAAAIPHLNARVLDPDEGLPVKMEAVSSLAWIGGGEVLAMLEAILQDSEHQKPEMRALAAAAIGVIGEERELSLLLGSLEDEQEPIVQRKILQAVDRIGARSASTAMARQNEALPNAQASGRRQSASFHRWY